MAALSKLVQWLPKAVEASADDIAQLGPNAARVRSLLDFLPGISDEAASLANTIDRRVPAVINRKAAYFAARDAGRPNPLANVSGFGDLVHGAARSAYFGENASDLLDPATYRALTNPLAAARATDLLRSRPRYQGTPFLETVQNLATRGAITGPRDVVRAGRIARQPEDVRGLALELISSGVDINKALPIARRTPADIIETMKVFLQEGMDPETAEIIARAV